MTVSFCLPQAIEVSAFTTLSDLSAFSLAIPMCSEKSNSRSNVTPRILGFLTAGTSVLSILRFSVVLYSAGSAVKRVAVVCQDLG